MEHIQGPHPEIEGLMENLRGATLPKRDVNWTAQGTTLTKGLMENPRYYPYKNGENLMV